MLEAGEPDMAPRPGTPPPPPTAAAASAATPPAAPHSRQTSTVADAEAPTVTGATAGADGLESLPSAHDLVSAAEDRTPVNLRQVEASTSAAASSSRYGGIFSAQALLNPIFAKGGTRGAASARPPAANWGARERSLNSVGPAPPPPPPEPPLSLEALEVRCGARRPS